MSKCIKTLYPIEVYERHSTSAHVIQTIDAGLMIPYTREKRREGINWLEIVVNGYKKGYIRKDKNEVSICKHVELSDREASGFDYSFYGDNDLSFNDVFKPVKASDAQEIPEHILSNSKTVDIKRIKEKGKSEYITLRYDPRLVNVTPFTLKEKELFYVTKTTSLVNGAFMEVDNKFGKKGYMLQETFYTSLKDKWIGYVGTIIAAILIIGVFLVFLSTGWIVMGTIFFIPAILIAFILVMIIKLILSLIQRATHQILIRL